jgi:hypothetical protein
MEFKVTRIIAPTSLAMAAQRWVLPARVNPKTINFTEILKMIFSMILRVTLLPIRIQYSSFSRLESRRVTSDVSMARAAPAPIATPI